MSKNYIGKTIKNLDTLKMYDLLYYESTKTVLSFSHNNENDSIVETLISETGTPINSVGVELINSAYNNEKYISILHNLRWILNFKLSVCILIHRFKGKKPTMKQVEEAYEKYKLNRN